MTVISDNLSLLRLSCQHPQWGKYYTTVKTLKTVRFARPFSGEQSFMISYPDKVREILKVAKLKWTSLTSPFSQQVSKSVDELKWIFLVKFYRKFSVLFGEGLKKRLMQNFRHLRTRQYQKSRTKSAKSKETVTNFHTFS